MGRAYQADRLEEVFAAFATMAPREQIVRTLATKWGLRARTVARYVAEAERILAARAQDPMALEERREHLAQSAILLYRKQLAAQHYAAASRTLDMIARWHGIGTPQQVAATLNLFAPNGIMTSQAIADHVRQLEADQAARIQSLAKQITGQVAGSDQQETVGPQTIADNNGGDDEGRDN
jgi:hypothetical protein